MRRIRRHRDERLFVGARHALPAQRRRGEDGAGTRLRAARRAERRPLLDARNRHMEEESGEDRSRAKGVRASRLGEWLLLDADSLQRQWTQPGDAGGRKLAGVRGVRHLHCRVAQGRAGAFDVGRDERADLQSLGRPGAECRRKGASPGKDVRLHPPRLCARQAA